MTLQQIRQQVMFQIGGDEADLGDYLPHLNDYINEGYDQLLAAVNGKHLSDEGEYPPRRHEKSQPELPAHLHRALADYAAWMVYRNGSAQRQSRGAVFRRAFEECLSRARLAGAAFIRNIPR